MARLCIQKFFMKRFEVEFEKNIYWIVSFERSKTKQMFSYSGEVHVSSYRTAEANRLPLFFSFQFSRTETGWDEMGELEIKAQQDEANDMFEIINELLIKGIMEFEDLK
jgi:hypothetical protein